MNQQRIERYCCESIKKGLKGTVVNLTKGNLLELDSMDKCCLNLSTKTILFF